MSLASNLLNEKRKRIVATVMGAIEAEVELSPLVRRDLRAKVIAAINQYHDGALDLVKACVDEGSMINDEALVVLARMDSSLRRLAERQADS